MYQTQSNSKMNSNRMDAIRERNPGYNNKSSMIQLYDPLDMYNLHNEKGATKVNTIIPCRKST